MLSKSFRLRDYQKTALDSIDSALSANDDPVLLQAIMGAGKTVMVARLINKYWFDTNRKFLVLAHKKELVEQFYNTFAKMTDIPTHQIGICCASMNRRQTKKRLIIGTIQTFVNCLDKYHGCDLLVIDEAHRVSVGTNSQYDKVIKELNSHNCNMRILGVTATPSRLGHGYIYGTKCKPGSVNLFPRRNHKISYTELKKDGYLAPLTGLVATHKNLSADLAGVHTNGDYVLDELGDIMSREIHLHTAVDAISEYANGRNKICVFCCTIDHAERLYSLLGDDATIVHSKLSPIERASNMRAWTHGDKSVIVSINILVEGFDFPALDCLVMARPTLSSSLFLQAVGRVLRTHETKTNGLLIDLTDNTSRFGTNLDKIKVSVPKAVEKQIKKEQELIKLCPACEQECHIALRVCVCGYEWPAAECVIADEMPELEQVNFEPKPPEWHKVNDMKITVYTSKKTDKELGKITFDYGFSMYRPNLISLFFCLPDNYSGFAVERSRQRWPDLSDDPFPQTVDDFYKSNFYQPVEILIDENGEYPEIKELKMVPF